MRAFRYLGDKGSIHATDVDVPEPEPGQILVKVQAAGLCASDHHIVSGNGDFVTHTPITLGHETAGVIVSLGDGVTNFGVGDRVALAIKSHPIGSAKWSEAPGLGYDGGFAEYVIGLAENCVKLPENVSFAQAAVATDSISTAYHAVVTEAEAKASSTIAIIGLGGLGLMGLRIAVLQKATVYGVDINEQKFQVAKDLGAKECFSSLESLRDVHIDAIVDFAGTATTTAGAVNTVAPGGRVVLVGLAAKEITIDSQVLITRGIRLQGSIGSSLEEFKAVLELINSGDLTPMLEEIPFDNIPQGIHRLGRGDVFGRLFTNPSVPHRAQVTS